MYEKALFAAGLAAAILTGGIVIWQLAAKRHCCKSF